jgi:hypothetical protein
MGDLKLLTPEMITSALTGIAKQAVEKIDNVRVQAGKVFSSILHFSTPGLDCIPHRETLLRAFPLDFCKTVMWRCSAETFPRFAQLIPLERYTYSILSGFVVSGGSLSDKILKDANGAITSYLQDVSDSEDSKELERIGAVLIQIFKDNFKVERVTIPLMKFLTQLLQSGLMTPLLSDESDQFGQDLIECVKQEINCTKRVEKIAAGVELLCETMQGNANIVRMALKRLVVYICHPYPRVRYLTANKIYEALLAYGDALECPGLEAAIAILSETSFESELNDMKLKRAEFCKLMGIPEPVSLKKT